MSGSPGLPARLGRAGLGSLAHGLVGRRAWAELAAYGPLLSTPDETTGLHLLKVPAAFRYRSLSWRNDPLSAELTVISLSHAARFSARAPVAHAALWRM